MSSPSFNPQPFLNELPSFNYLVDPSKDATGATLDVAGLEGTPAYTGLFTEWEQTSNSTSQSTFETQLQGMFTQMSPGNVNPSTELTFPNSWASFITTFRNYFKIPDNATLGISSANLNSGPAFDGFLQSFQQTLQTGPSSAVSTTGSDWSALDPSQIATQFTNSFAGFLGDYPFNKSTDNAGNVVYNPETPQTFLNNYLHFISVTAVNENATLATASYGDLLSYQQAYKAFFPNSTQQDFDAALSSFATEVTNDSANGGYFNPSQDFARFFTETQNKYLVFQATQGTLQANKGVQLAILWEVFALVTSMVQSIEKVTAISAQRLGYLTNLQQAYTNLINSIPTFLNGQPFSSDDTGPINAKNQAFAQNLRSYSDLVSSASKSLQSNVSSLNDATNTTANLVTSIIQEMSTLISTIAK